MKIKSISDLNGKKNNLFYLVHKDDEPSMIYVYSNYDNALILITADIKELIRYGFDVIHAQRIENVKHLEEIADNENVFLVYRNGYWIYEKHGQIHSLNNLLSKYNLYV